MTAYINGSLCVSTGSWCNIHTPEHEVYSHKCLFNIFCITLKRRQPGWVKCWLQPLHWNHVINYIPHQSHLSLGEPKHVSDEKTTCCWQGEGKHLAWDAWQTASVWEMSSCAETHSLWTDCVWRSAWSSACVCTRWAPGGSSAASPCSGPPRWAPSPASGAAPERHQTLNTTVRCLLG